MDINDVSWIDNNGSDDDASHAYVRTVRMNGARRQVHRPDTNMDVDDTIPVCVLLLWPVTYINYLYNSGRDARPPSLIENA
jgi:hypothetical protein